MERSLHDLNDLTGLFPVALAFAVGSCAKSLAGIRAELKCPHEDFETTHGAHEVKEGKDRARYRV